MSSNRDIRSSFVAADIRSSFVASDGDGFHDERHEPTTAKHHGGETLDATLAAGRRRGDRGTSSADLLFRTSTTSLVRQSETIPPVITRMPNTAFGISMGLAGHSIMWKEMRNANFVTERVDAAVMEGINSMFWYLAATVAGMIAIAYAYKAVTSFPLVRAEYLCEVRCHFFNAPNLIFIMLLIGLPDHINIGGQTLRGLWAVAFCYHIFMTQLIYKAWMFSKRRNFTEAKPQFLMSTVGWFLLANLGQSAQLREEWGIGLPRMCFGAGFILYIDITIFIFGGLHENKGLQGSPGMFLLIAPPSIGVVSLDLFNDGATDFSPSAEMLLGWVYVLLLLLIRLGPVLWRKPSVFGEYWAYVFPLAAATTSTVRYAGALETNVTEVLAMMMIVVATITLLGVFGRMIYHIYECIVGQYQWRDPLFHQEYFRH